MAMSSSSSASSGPNSTATTNPFADPPNNPAVIAAAAIQHVNICTHVPDPGLRRRAARTQHSETISQPGDLSAVKYSLRLLIPGAYGPGTYGSGTKTKSKSYMQLEVSSQIHWHNTAIYR
ncbi:hypothetical protein EJB05_10034, partial [Eragrostis curvula]